MTMSLFEKRWCDALFNALMPTTPAMPGIATLTLDKFWSDFEKSAPPLLKFGLRFAIWYLTLRPILSFRFHRPFPLLQPSAQEIFLTKVNDSHFYFKRQLITTLKAVACMAYFDDPKIRQMVE